MGIYATTTSIPEILPGFLKSNTSTSDTAGVAIFTKKITNAEAKINSVISIKYDISGFTAIPPLLTKMTEDMAAYLVIRDTGYRASNRNQYMDDFQMAIDTLKQLMEGDIGLTYTDGSSVVANVTKRYLSSTLDYTQIFGLDDQTKWKRDRNEIDDQTEERNT